MKKQRKKICGILFALAVTAMLGWNGRTVAEAAETSYFHAYEKYDYETISDRYALTVNETPVDVVTYYNGRYDYAHIAYEGTAVFQVKSLKGNISEYNVSPHSYGLDVQLTGDTLTFEMEQQGSRYMVVEVTVDGITQQLFIAADPKPALEKPDLNAENVVNIMDCGIRMPFDEADGLENSAIIQNAMDELSAAGGGTLYFPAGTYKFVTLDARADVTLFLDEGAVLRGSGKRTDYVWADSGQNGRQAVRRDILIDQADNFAIIGYGMIDANSVGLALKRGQIASPGVDNREQPAGYYPDGWDDFRKGIVDAHDTDGITFSGIAFKDATGWTFNIQTSDHIQMSNVKILDDYKVVHTDGYDFCSSRNVTVYDSFGICGDDVFCPKAEYGGKDTCHILFQDCVGYAGAGAGCKIGVAARSDAYNIEFNNIDIIQAKRAMSVSHDEGLGVWEDIRFIDVRMDRILIPNPGDTGQYRSAPFVVWTYDKEANVGTVNNVEITRCSIENYGGLKGVIRGCREDATVTNVRITDLKLGGVTLTAENYEDYVIYGNNIASISYNGLIPLKEEGRVYEAEEALFDESIATVNNKSWASGGKLVGNIGLMDVGVSSLTYTVSAESAGSVKLVVYYASKDSNNTARRTQVIVNDGTPIELSCPGSNWNQLRDVSTVIELKAGENTITLTNAEGPCPNMDKIEIQPVHVHLFEESWSTDALNHWHASTCGHNIRMEEASHKDINRDQICDVCRAEVEATIAPSATEKTVFEAESAAHTEGVTVNSKSWASGGKIAGNVGLIEGREESLTFTVTSEVGGVHELVLRYASRDAAKEGLRYSTILVNGTEIGTIACSGDGWDNPKEVSVQVELSAGDNTIVITNRTAPAPNIDCITLIHSHTYEEGWSFDQEMHWYQATCGHAYRKDTAAHTDENEDGVCDVCSADLNDSPQPPVSGGDSETTPAPTEAPTQAPTEAPTQTPTGEPTPAPTEAPSQTPTEAPTQTPAQVTSPKTDDETTAGKLPLLGAACMLFVVLGACIFVRRKA